MTRLRIGIVFGGRSVEHEVSLVSARSLAAAFDPRRYEVVPIGVTRAGRWLVAKEVACFLPGGIREGAGEPTALLADPSITGLVRLDPNGGPRTDAPLDVIFPLIHGPYGEDGKLQGLLEMADLPYVGSGVLGSAVGMDKEVSRRLLAAGGIPVVDYCVVRSSAWTSAGTGRVGEVERQVEARLGYPCFVKPASLGSSVGVAKARDRGELHRAVDDALSFDEKVLVERAVDAREIEVAVLGNEEPQASVPGEIVHSREFYDYEAKYEDGGTRLVIPASVPAPLASTLRDLSLKAFRALELAGLARVDFLLDRRTEAPYLNEVNTLPGFTPVSMYPKLWEASGIGYGALVDRLVELAIERHRRKRALRTDRPEPPRGDASA